MEKEKAKEWLSLSVGDLFMNFLYYDRKEDEEMDEKKLRKLMDDGIVSKQMMIDAFIDQINKEYD